MQVAAGRWIGAQRMKRGGCEGRQGRQAEREFTCEEQSEWPTATSGRQQSTVKQRDRPETMCAASGSWLVLWVETQQGRGDWRGLRWLASVGSVRGTVKLVYVARHTEALFNLACAEQPAVIRLCFITPCFGLALLIGHLTQ